MATADTHPFTFLHLPPEVRTMIYTALFTNACNSIAVVESEHATDHAVTVTNHGYPLLQTCRTIYHEARQHVACERLVFRTHVRRAGYEATLQLPKLGQHLAGSLFAGVTTVTVGVTDLWRVIGSLGSLKTRMAKLQTVRAVVIKRMPHRYWRELFPSVVGAVTTSREPLDLAATAVPDLERARFRCHVRSHPLINEDEHYTDDDEDGYTEDRGDELFPRSVAELSDRGLRLHVCARWILVDRRGGNAVRLEVVGSVEVREMSCADRMQETVFDLASGRILEVRRGACSPPMSGGEVVCSVGSVGDIERQTVLELPAG